ncbi:hypothetical protein ATCC90586_010383 [Pythium insidiosum]|nr:hypothetical protein ATCC90586_010383 [Pythium insidiosum]
MWPRLSEYVAEIVAPADESPRAEIGEEIWSRFTNIVAPPAPAGDDAAADGAADEQELYISELERALLLKKKQNEQLSDRVAELERLINAASKSNTPLPDERLE